MRRGRYLNSMVDYSICSRQHLRPSDLGRMSVDWDIFVSAFNTSTRVTEVFDCVRARRKVWVVQQEYGLSRDCVPVDAFVARTRQEAEFWYEFEAFAGKDWTEGSVCVDITGFMRPQLVFLVMWLVGRRKRPFVALYSDPIRYASRENTVFSKGPVVGVRQISGCEGLHNSDSTSDCLLIGMGYDDELVRRVAESKEDAKKVQVYGLPSLEADMYQESVFRCHKANEALGQWGDELCFAPANDPFATANVLQDRVRQEEDGRGGLTNLYLSPLGTKPQTLGFALYFATERRDTASSIIFPFTESYEPETSKGIARTWVYNVECLGG